MDLKETQQKMAEMLFYAKSPKAGKFEKLEDHEKKIWLEQSGNVLVIIDKMGLELVDKGRPDPLSPDEKKEKVEQIIKDFNKDLKVFKKEMYPAGELAWRIIKA